MAVVCRVFDTSLRKDVALKSLVMGGSERNYVLSKSLFEREYHTLAQLRHPHVVEVFEYGCFADGTPYYTMELLSGSDLLSSAPLPWREACAVFFDICSCLALLHSRGLLHRDVSPPNVFCTTQGGAKLLDFGALAPMSSGGAEIVGTPAFIAPESLGRLALDARTDLFSLGAALYFAVTGQVPYRARTFAGAQQAWLGTVVAPSSLVPEVPAALDNLILSLVHVEPALRPQRAFDVMQVLASLAGRQSVESDAVSYAYLVTPSLVGRDALMGQVRAGLACQQVDTDGAWLLEGPAGVGRSRLLNACTIDARTLGYLVVRGAAVDERTPFAAAQALVQHLAELLAHEVYRLAPDLFQKAPGWDWAAAGTPPLLDFADFDSAGEELSAQVLALLRQVSVRRPLLIAVDDLQYVDAHSAALLSLLMNETAGGRLKLVLTSVTQNEPSLVVDTLRRRCTVLQVARLTVDQVQRLLCSVFGDAANIGMLGREMYGLTGGLPRDCMGIAQYLVHQRTVRYEAGAWVLPGRLTAAEMPATVLESIKERYEAFSEQARLVVQAIALAFAGRLTTEQCQFVLDDAVGRDTERVLAELLTKGAIVTNGQEHSLQSAQWRDALAEALLETERRSCHRLLARLHEGQALVPFTYHALWGGLDEDGLRSMQRVHREYGQKYQFDRIVRADVRRLAPCHPLAIAVAQRLGQGRRAVYDLMRWQLFSSLLQEDAAPKALAMRVCQQLEHDAGLDLYWADNTSGDGQQRLFKALQGAKDRYGRLPEVDRGYPVEEAIRVLAEYVVVSLGLGVRSHDAAWLATLPPLVEPFVSLSPALEAIWCNARMTLKARFQLFDVARRDGWVEVLEKFNALDHRALRFAESVGYAVAHAIAVSEVHLGLPSALQWAEYIERDPYHKVSGLQLRRIVAMEQGDSQAAEQLRRDAELITLRTRVPQMMKELLGEELLVCAYVWDLVGIQDVLERIRPLAHAFPGWKVDLLIAEAYFHLVRGDLLTAKAKCEECLGIVQPVADKGSSSPYGWLRSTVCLAETHLALQEPAQAERVARELLDGGALPGLEQAAELQGVLAVAEGQQGKPMAAARLEKVILMQKQRGVTGLRLGMGYEMRARIAMAQGHAGDLAHYAALAAAEYRHGENSALGVRYERLVNDARRSGLLVDRALVEGSEAGMVARVKRCLAQQSGVEGRVAAALELLCQVREASAGLLYLVGPEGLYFGAAYGDAEPFEDLRPLEEARERAREAAGYGVDDMVTVTALAPDSSPPQRTAPVTLEGAVMLLLSCRDAAGRLADVGVAVLMCAKLRFALQHDEALLTCLAGELRTVVAGGGAVRSG